MRCMAAPYSLAVVPTFDASDKKLNASLKRLSVKAFQRAAERSTARFCMSNGADFAVIDDKSVAHPERAAIVIDIAINRAGKAVRGLCIGNILVVVSLLSGALTTLRSYNKRQVTTSTRLVEP
jgi:hypothetical protein